MWRMVDDMWIDHTFQHDFDQDEASDSQKAIARI